ncbi:M23 family metallopeptidase [bacterium]|nr:MAG: M23 family metallopeptidase [bacterium]
MNKGNIIILTVVLAALLGYLVYSQTRPDPLESIATNQAAPTEENQFTTSPSPENEPTQSSTRPEIAMPISQAEQRITKKSYGTYVTPQNSPVSPEVFTGYHTGADFEVFDTEANTDVDVNAICDGELLRKTTATGYGGYALQSCNIEGKAVTVVYGHMRLSSISAKVGNTLTAGEKIGVLGTGYSNETSNERKHLHLSIHVGTSVDIRGYVQGKAALSAWMDPKVVLGL